MKKPKLRFHEFNGKWFEKPVQDLAKVVDCKHRTPEYLEDGIPVISPGTIRWGKLDTITPVKSVSIEEYESLMDHCSPQIGDMVFSRNQSIGVASLVQNDDKFVLGQDTVLIQPNNSGSQFLYYSLQTYHTQTSIKRVSGGSTFSRINLKDIRGLKVSISSSVEEQQKIASFLTAVDTKIEQLTQKVELLQQYKKGVMQQLFSQKLRFKDDEGKDYPEWEERKLGEVAYITTGSSNRIDSGLDGEFTFFDRSQDIRTSDKFLFDAEAIIVAGEGQEFVPKYFVGKFDLHQRTYAIMNFQGCNGKFLHYLITHKRHYLYSQAVGSTVKSLRLPIFKKMPLNIPCLEEQTKIANFLSAIDAKIELVQTQLENTRQFKKGLLQQMFV